MTVLLLLACAPPMKLKPPPIRADSVYFALVDRFADGRQDAPGSTDPDDLQAWHGGDLPGLVQRVPWLAEQGYGTLWISPITDARETPIGEWGAYHGYWMHRPDAVDPRYGTLEDARALSEALHAHGMRLVLDLVVNHVGPGSPVIEAHPDWFHGLGDITDWNDSQQVVNHDVHGLPDLAQENPAVAAWLTDSARFWIREVSPDGLRIDAVRHVPPGFLATYGDTLRSEAGPGFQLLGEVFDGNPARLAERARSDRLDSQFDFPLMYGIRESALCSDTDHQKLVANLFTERHLPERPEGNLAPLVTLLDNHDTPRIAGVCAHPARALALLFGLRGTPSVTWGTEAGMDGVHEPANRASMPWGSSLPLAPLLRRLNDLRARWAPLRHGNQAVVQHSPESLVVVRWTPTEAVHVVHHVAPARYPGTFDEAWRVDDSGVVPWDGEPFTGVLLAHTTRTAGLDTLPRETTVSVGPLSLSEGEKAFVTGSAPELGAWSAKGAVPVRDGRAVFALPRGTGTATKLVITGPDGERWSPAADITVLAGGTVHLEWD